MNVVEKVGTRSPTLPTRAEGEKRFRSATRNPYAATSVGTSKPANDGHLKTGQRTERRDEVLYSFIGK
jgi:hypothetical protein